MNLKYEIVRQEWIESERGWGQRPDGHSLHRTSTDRDMFIALYWAKMPARDRNGNPPDEYSFPAGDTRIVSVDEKTYKEVCDSNYGVRY